MSWRVLDLLSKMLLSDVAYGIVMIRVHVVDDALLRSVVLCFLFRHFERALWVAFAQSPGGVFGPKSVFVQVGLRVMCTRTRTSVC